MASYSTQSQFTEYQRLVAEYRDSVTRCLASLDQLRAAERDLRAMAFSLVSEDGQECTAPEMARALMPLTIQTDGENWLEIEHLSDREFEVFALIGAGLTSREIAEMLHIAMSTVETYRERLKDKLRLSNGNALTRLATIWAMSRHPTTDGADG